jgi:hypothetical protein
MGNTFVAQTGNANTVIGTASATLSPPGSFTGTWSLTGTDAASFRVNSSTGVLSVGPSDVTTVRTYNINIVATGSYPNSPLPQAETLNGIAPGELLTTNATVTRPFQQLGSGLLEDYPYSWVNATITGGANLGFITPTQARRISFEESLRFERVHEETYRSFGFELVPIATASLLDRVDAIKRSAGSEQSG